MNTTVSRQCINMACNVIETERGIMCSNCAIIYVCVFCLPFFCQIMLAEQFQQLQFVVYGQLGPFMECRAGRELVCPMSSLITYRHFSIAIPDAQSDRDRGWYLIPPLASPLTVNG
jgi:hypothetical protein